MDNFQEVEMAVIGAFLNNPDSIEVARSAHGLTPEMFGLHQHGAIVSKIFEVRNGPSGKNIDAFLMSQKLKDAGVLDDVGGMPYLMQCIDHAPIGLNEAYCEYVREEWVKRRVQALLVKTMTELEKTEDTGTEFLKTVPQRFFEIMPEKMEKRTKMECLEASLNTWKKVVDGEMKMPGISTGYDKLDEILGGGYTPGFHVIAARPSAGKTSLEGCIMSNIAKRGIPVARACMDMDMQNLLNRDVCREGGVSLPKLNMGYGGKKNLADAEEAAFKIHNWPMHILEQEYDIDKICAWICLMKMKHDIQIASVDYVQLCMNPSSKVFMSDVQRIGHCSLMLKKLGQELNIPILVLAQINRESSKENRMPTLADIKGCGDIEQHAQTVILLSKAKFDYDTNGIDEVTQRAIWCDVAKNQQGGVGANEMWFHCSYFAMEFADADWGYPEY